MSKLKGRVLYVLLFILFNCSLLFALDVIEEGEKVQIRTEMFSVVLNNKGVIETITLPFNKKEIATNISLTAVECGEQDKFNKTFARSPVIENQKDGSTTNFKITQKTENSVAISFEWEGRLVKANQSISIKEGVPYIDVSYSILPKIRLSEVYVQLRSNTFGSSTLFYPEGARYGSNEGWEYHSLLPGYIFAYDPTGQGGVGLLVDKTENLYSFGYLQRGEPEGFSGRFLSMGVFSRPLRWDSAGQGVSFNLKVLAGTLQQATAAAEGILSVGDRISIKKVMPSKLIYWPDEEGEGIITLQNNSSEKSEVDLLVSITGRI
ncbi:MAG: hypothetical protein PHI44_04695, partial [Candidatus Ratteibacteria bacterium]|nr:hypothetical protein [Candidatus Ratteibacteria bacterium]